MLAVISALVIGNIPFLGTDYRYVVTESILSPILNAFIGFFNTYAGLMIASIIISGILNVGDASSLNRIGKYIFYRIFMVMFLLSACVVPLITLFFDLHISQAAASGESQVKQVVDLILGIVSKNFVDPFLTANTMQIIFMAVIIGFVLLTVRTKTPQLCAFFEESAVLHQNILSLVCKLIPVFVFVSLLKKYI